MVQGEGTNPQVGKVTVDEFAARIKEKYPEYQEVDNLELAKAIVEKYPEYEPVVSFEPIDAAPVKKKEGAIPSPSLDGESPSTPSALETAVARTNTFMQPVYDVADWVNVNIPIWSNWASVSTQMSGGITSALDALVKEATLYFAPDSPYKESIKQQIKEKGIDAAIDTPLEDLANNMREYGGAIAAKRKENYGVALEDQEKGIVGNALEGNWYNTAVLAVDGMTDGMIQAGLASVTGIAPLAVSAGGEKYYDVSNKKDYSSTERLLYSTSVGLMEGLVETIFRTDINAFKKVLDSDIALKSFEEELLRAAKNTPWYKEFLKAGTEEGFEEALTESFGQVLTGLKEGTRPDPVALAEAFVMGFLPGAGTHVITNGISAIGSEKRTKRRQQLNKQIEELRAKAEETEDPVQKGIIEDMVKGDIEDLNKEIELDAELYGNFSDEDAKEIQKINTEIRNLYQKVGLAVSPEQKEKYKGQILDARSRKLEIENRYSEEPVRYIKDGRMVTKAQFVEMINAATPEELSTGQWGVENDPDVEKLLLSKLPQGDTKKETGVPSTQQAGQAPIQAQPIQEGGVEAPPTGGVVQEARETEVELVKEERAKPEYVVQKVSALPVEDTEQLTQELEGEFGLLTGENPMAETMTEEENAALNQRAELWLRAKGYSPRRVSGKYGQAENSFFVPGLTKEDAIAFAKEFNQESVAHSEGLIYQDGSMNPRVKEDDNFSFSEFNNDSDFVSVVNTADGPRTFQVGYNFDTKVGEAPAKEAPAKKEAPKKKSKADTLKAAERGVQKFGEPFTKLVDNFNNLLSKLGGSNIPVYVVDGDTYKAVTGTSSRGTFRTIDGQRTIVVNADKATLGTVYHEMMHGYIVSMNLSPRQIVSFVNTIKAELKKGNATEKKLANQLERFQKEYINQEIYGKGLTLDDPNIAEEFAAEFVAQIKDNVDIDQMSVSTIDKIRLAVAKFINKTFKVNIDTTPIESRQEAFDFMNGFLDALEGRAAVAPKVNQTANPYQAQRSRLQIETPAGSKLFNSPLEDATTLARQYMASKGLEYREGKPFNNIDEARAKRISDAFDAMENDPTNPEVAAAYKAMAEETIEQYEFITNAGYKVEINNEEPYNNSGDMISDLRDNKRMKIFSTESGFGDEAITDKQRKENPLLQRTKYKDVNGQPLLVNDLFRFVHDFFGHAKRGNSFGPKGEENAWDVHSRMYTPMARRAMTSETRGQNSYVNFSGVNTEAFKLRDEARKLRREGKLEEANELTGKVYDMMTFAEQKVGLLPDEFVENDYDNPPSLTPQEEQGESGEVGTINIPKEQIEVIDSPKLSEDSRSFVQKFVTDIKMTALQGRRFVTNMYDYTNAGVTNLGNGLYIELFGGRNYVPMMMERNGVGLGDVSNLAAFNSKEQAEGFIRNATKGKADLFGPHSGGLEGSWQFQHHIFDSLVNLVLDNKILSKTELIDLFNTGLNTKGPAGGIKAFEKFNERNNSKLKNLNKFKKNPLELVELLNAENNYSPNLRKILNQKIASNKKFQKAIGVKNLNEFHNRISDPLNIGVSGGEIMTFVEFDPSTFKIVKTKPGDVNHHPSFGWVVMAKIKAIHHPDKYYKSYDITDSYTKHNVEGTVVENKSEATKKQFIESNVKSSAGAIAKIAEVDLPREQIDFAGIEMKVEEVPAGTSANIPTGGIAYVPVSKLYNLMDMRSGRKEMYESAEDKKRVAKLVEAFKKEGFEYKGSDFIYVDIDADGYGWIGEGNHRVLAARQLGMTHLPVRVEFGAARDGKSIYSGRTRVPTQVISKEKIDELRKKAGKNYHIKYASIWETGLPANEQPTPVSREQIDFEGSEMINEFSWTEQVVDPKTGKLKTINRTEKSDKPIGIKFPDGTVALVRSFDTELKEAQQLLKEVKSGAYPYMDEDQVEYRIDLIKKRIKRNDVVVELIDGDMKYHKAAKYGRSAMPMGSIELSNNHYNYYFPRVAKMLGKDHKAGLMYSPDNTRGTDAVEIYDEFQGKGFGSRLYFAALRLLREQVPGARLISNHDFNVRRKAKNFWRSQVNNGLARVIANTATKQEIEQLGGPEVLKQLKDIGAEYTGDIYELLDPTERTAPSEQYDVVSEDVAKQQIDWQASLFGKGQVNPAIVNRNDVVQEAAYDLLTGKITNAEYQEVVRITQSIDPITQFFLPASTKDMADALDSNKGKLLNVQLEDGTEIGLRLDIPAYKNRNIWVVSIHDSGKAGKSLSYGSVAWATDVTFGSNPKVAAFIAAGQNLDTGKKQDKTTIARMHGKWKNFEGKTKEERDASAVKKVEEIVAIESSFAGAGRKGSPWRQIGMNPFRHSFFYDRRTGQPVIAAAEVVQIGGLVYAKDVVYADKNDPIFEVTGYKDANGETVRFQLEDQVNEERNNEETYESVEKNQEGLFDADLNAAVDNDVANSASWQERPRTLFEKFVDLTRLKIQDKFRNLIKIQEDIEYSSGKPVGLDEDFRNAEALMHGAAKEELNKTEEKVGVIAKLIKASGLTLERFNDLLYAMHAQERNRYLRVISTDVGKSLMDMRKKLEMKPSEVAEMLGITTEDYNKIEANKIALKTSELRDILLIYGTTPSRFFYDNAKVKNGSGMTDVEAREILAKYGLDLASPDVSQLKPRIRVAVQAVRDLTADTRRRLVEGGLESQDTIDAFNETYKNYVPLRGFAEGDVDSEIIEGGRKIEVRGREKRAKGRETKADSPLTQAIIANTTTIIRAEKNGVMTRFFNLAKNNPNKDVYEVVDPAITKEYKRELRNGKIITTAKTIADYMMDPKMVAVRIDGDYKFIRFKDQRLADAFRGANVVKAEWMVKYLGQFNRALSSFITTYDPEFVLRNFSRDIQTAVLNLFAEQEISEGLIKDKNIVANVVADTLPALKSIFAVEGGATGKKKASKNKEMDQYYREFKEDGARTEWFYSKSASEVQKDIEKLLEGKGESSLTAALNLVERINSSVENAVRLSSYVNARKAGIPRAKAAELAKNLTVNFNKSGEWGQIGNTLYLFFNASVQGTSRLIRSLKPRYIVDSEGNRKLQVTTAQKMAIGLSLMGSLMSLLNEGLSDDDEDDKSFYSKIPDFEKERNIIIMKPNGKDYWKIPLPYGVNVFYVAGTSLADAAQRIKTPGEAVVGIMEAAVGSFSPINFPSSGDFSKFVTKFITPTIGQIPASLAMNENYFGQTIYNENFPFDTSPKPESELGRKGGYRWTKELTRFLNKVSGGSEFRSGAIDINPDKIDFVLESLTGGMGKFVTRSANVIDKAITGNWDELEARQVPFLRVFYGQSPKYANVQEFYSRSVLVNQMQEEVKAKIITGPEAKRVSKMFYLGKNIRKRLSEIKKKEDAAKLIKDPVLQEERLDALEKLRYKLVADYNKQYERFEIDKLK